MVRLCLTRWDSSLSHNGAPPSGGSDQLPVPLFFLSSGTKVITVCPTAGLTSRHLGVLSPGYGVSHTSALAVAQLLLMQMPHYWLIVNTKSPVLCWPKHNIICERDFAQLDRQLKERPQAGSIALSGMVCFINNKTPEYMESLSDEEKHKVIE